MCKAKFHESNVKQMNSKNPKIWWKEVKRLSGMRSQMNIKELENLSPHELANTINKAFLEPLEEYRLSCSRNPIPLEETSPEFLEVSKERVFKLLSISILQRHMGPMEFRTGFYEGTPNSLLSLSAKF